MSESQPIKRLGDLLVAAGAISPDQLREALDLSRRSGRRLGEVIVARGYASEIAVARALAGQLGAQFLEPADLRPEPAALRAVPEALARRHRALPLSITPTTMTVALADPLNGVAIDDLRMVTRREVRVAVCTETALNRSLERAYVAPAQAAPAGAGATGGPGATGGFGAARGDPPGGAGEAAADHPVVRLVGNLLDQAIADRASDLHLEPQADGLRVRFRIDGLLQEISRVGADLAPQVVSRVKVLAGMDVSEHRTPQDGRFQIRGGGRDVDVRASTLPAIHGEKIVLRLLDKTQIITDLASLGLRTADRARYDALLRRPFGMILITGPTGSGKTTTLTATLAELNRPDVNIVTIEDPVEYDVPGVNQVQVNERAGLTFAAGLRAVLRQDPNIVMVGEIRDAETAEIAVRAALTGHLVFSTVHTNDAAGAVTRLVDMGVERYLVASALSGVVAQRLVRAVCPHCREPRRVEPPPEQRAMLRLPAGEIDVVEGRGCDRCGGTGYRGRLALFEVMAVTPAIRALVLAGAPAEQIAAQAAAEGVEPLIEDGLSKALEGRTTLAEVRRIAYQEET